MGSLLSVFFTSKKVECYEDVLSCDLDKICKFITAFLRENGIYVAPSQFEAAFISNAHTAEDIKNTLDVIAEFGGKE